MWNLNCRTDILPGALQSDATTVKTNLNLGDAEYIGVREIINVRVLNVTRVSIRFIKSFQQ